MQIKLNIFKQIDKILNYYYMNGMTVKRIYLSHKDIIYLHNENILAKGVRKTKKAEPLKLIAFNGEHVNILPKKGLNTMLIIAEESCR